VGGGAQGEREADSPLRRDPEIPRPWDHDLSLRQPVNQLSHPGAPEAVCLILFCTTVLLAVNNPVFGFLLFSFCLLESLLSGFFGKYTV